MDRSSAKIQTERKKSAEHIGANNREASSMRGYYVSSGYYGLVDGRYLLFASESDYFEAMEEEAA